MTTFFTVCNLNYLPRALVLAASLLHYHNIKLKIYIFDKKASLDPSLLELGEIFWIEDFGPRNWQELAMKYDITEFSTSLKPYIALNLLKYCSKVIFLDPDTCLYSHLFSIINILDNYSIFLSPHYITPQPSTDNESDLSMMRFGSYNLGLWAVNNSPESVSFLEWWDRRCQSLCFMESQFGLSTDQKWVSIANCFFRSIYISFDLTLNVAPWNTFERKISFAKNTYIVNNSDRLKLFHFSGIRATKDFRDGYFSKPILSCEHSRDYAGLNQLCESYMQDLTNMSSKITQSPYAFDYMDSGHYISPTTRRAYLYFLENFPESGNPFSIDRPFYAFAKRNHLLRPNIKPYNYPGIQKTQLLKKSLKFNIMYFCMRSLLRLFGPNFFYDLTKLFAYMSLVRHPNHQFWKI